VCLFRPRDRLQRHCFAPGYRHADGSLNGRCLFDSLDTNRSLAHFGLDGFPQFLRLRLGGKAASTYLGRWPDFPVHRDHVAKRFCHRDILQHMEAVTWYPDPAPAQADKFVLAEAGIAAYVNGCAKQGYSLLVASGLLARAREVLASTRA
jgi:hypothetical protein